MPNTNQIFVVSLLKCVCVSWDSFKEKWLNLHCQEEKLKYQQCLAIQINSAIEKDEKSSKKDIV